MDRDLLVEIADYLTTRAREYAVPSPESVVIGELPPRVCEITFDEGRRTAMFFGVKEIAPGGFDDALSRITLNVTFQRLNEPKSSVKVAFDQGRWESKVDILLAVPHARESAFAIAAGLQAILARRKTWNWIFHPTLLPLVIGAVLVLYPAFALFQQPPTHQSALLVLPMFPAFVYMGCSWLRPYSRFDTPRNATKDIWFKWLWGGVGAVVTFVLAFARDWLVRTFMWV